LILFVRTAPIDLPRVNDVVIDGRVLGFAAAVGVVAALLVALLPAWRIGRGNVQSTLRSGGHGATDRGGLRVRAALLTTQVALSVTLLVVTGLFVASFVQLFASIPDSRRTDVVACRNCTRRPGGIRREGAGSPLRSDPPGHARASGHHVSGMDLCAAFDR
jgi:hypothetical protein